MSEASLPDDAAAIGWDVCSEPCGHAMLEQLMRALGKTRAERRRASRAYVWRARPDGCYRISLRFLDREPPDQRALGYPGRPAGVACPLCGTLLPPEPGSL